MVRGVDVGVTVLLLCVVFWGGILYVEWDRGNIRMDAVEELIGVEAFDLANSISLGKMGGVYLDLPVVDVYDVTWLEEGHIEVKSKVAVNYRTESATFVCVSVESAGCSNDKVGEG